MNISLHGHTVPTIDIEDTLLDVNGKDRIVTYIAIRCGGEEIKIDAFADDRAELNDAREQQEVA